MPICSPSFIGIAGLGNEGKRSASALAVGNRDLEGHSIFVADRSCDVTLAGEVFGQVDVSGSKLSIFVPSISSTSP